MDIWNSQKRSDVMSRIKSRDTKIEILVRSKLFKAGYRFRVNKKDLPGKPDIVLKKYNTVIYINGCFWHYHSKCKEGKIPKSNSQFWIDKISKNVTRDKRNYREIKKLGWNVIILWECEIEKNIDNIVDKVFKKLSIS